MRLIFIHFQNHVKIFFFNSDTKSLWETAPEEFRQNERRWKTGILKSRAQSGHQGEVGGRFDCILSCRHRGGGIVGEEEEMRWCFFSFGLLLSEFQLTANQWHSGSCKRTAAKWLQSWPVASRPFYFLFICSVFGHTVLSWVQWDVTCALSTICPVKGNSLFSQMKQEEEGYKAVRESLGLSASLLLFVSFLFLRLVLIAVHTKSF